MPQEGMVSSVRVEPSLDVPEHQKQKSVEDRQIMASRANKVGLIIRLTIRDFFAESHKHAAASRREKASGSKTPICNDR
jgi:hypothetical protein